MGRLANSSARRQCAHPGSGNHAHARAPAQFRVAGAGHDRDRVRAAVACGWWDAVRPRRLVAPVGQRVAVRFSLAGSGGRTDLRPVTLTPGGMVAFGYLAGEIRDPARTLPRCLIGGTATVTILYLAVNLVFVYALNPAAMMEKSPRRSTAGGGILATRAALRPGELRNWLGARPGVVSGGYRQCVRVDRAACGVRDGSRWRVSKIRGTPPPSPRHAGSRDPDVGSRGVHAGVGGFVSGVARLRFRRPCGTHGTDGRECVPAAPPEPTATSPIRRLPPLPASAARVPHPDYSPPLATPWPTRRGRLPEVY